MRPVEVVFTVSEEVGLMGARALDMSTLRSSTAVVLDSAGAVGTIINSAPQHDRIDATIIGGRPTPALPPKPVSAPSSWPRKLSRRCVSAGSTPKPPPISA